MSTHEKNPRWFYIHSIFPHLKSVISHNVSADVIHKYSRLFPLAVPSPFKQVNLIINGNEFGTIYTSHGLGFLICSIQGQSTKSPPLTQKQVGLPTYDDTSSSPSSSSGMVDYKQHTNTKPPPVTGKQKTDPAKDDTLSSCSFSLCLDHGKQDMETKPPPVTQAQKSYQMKDDAFSSSTSSSTIHSGTQAFELLLSDDDSYLNMKLPAITDFMEEQAEHHIPQHIFMTTLAQPLGRTMNTTKSSC